MIFSRCKNDRSAIRYIFANAFLGNSIRGQILRNLSTVGNNRHKYVSKYFEKTFNVAGWAIPGLAQFLTAVNALQEIYFAFQMHRNATLSLASDLEIRSDGENIMSEGHIGLLS